MRTSISATDVAEIFLEIPFNAYCGRRKIWRFLSILISMIIQRAFWSFLPFDERQSRKRLKNGKWFSVILRKRIIFQYHSQKPKLFYRISRNVRYLVEWYRFGRENQLSLPHTVTDNTPNNTQKSGKFSALGHTSPQKSFKMIFPKKWQRVEDELKCITLPKISINEIPSSSDSESHWETR